MAEDPEPIQTASRLLEAEGRCWVHTDGRCRYVIENPHDTEEGIKATVTLHWDGAVVRQDNLTLTSARRREGFAKACHEAQPGLDPEHIAERLLDVGAELKYRLEELAKDAAYQRGLVREPEILDEDVRQLAIARLQDPALLFRVGKAIEQLGVAGEEVNRLLVYLCYTSRLLKEPLSVIIKGESSGGKSYLAGRVLRLLPRSAYEDITDATPQSFFHLPDDWLQHKVVVLFEMEGAQKSEYPIRTLQSEGKLRLQLPVKDPETGEYATKIKELLGPVSFLTTTTRAMSHPENETRNVSLYIDESEDQTAKTHRVSSGKYTGEPPMMSDQELRVWRAMQQILEARPVRIPYVHFLEERFPRKPLRVRRDYNKFLALIEVIVNLHQYQRERRKIGDTEHLVAAIADYVYAKRLVERVLGDTIYQLSPKSKEVLRTCWTLNEHEVELTHQSIAAELRWIPKTVSRWIIPLVEGGFLNVVSGGGKGKTFQYTVCNQETETFTLPSLEELLTRCPELRQQTLRIVDPITGDEVTINDEKDSKTVSA